MELDPLILSRLQFALTIGFHFLFPPLTIGLAFLLVIIEWLGWRRGDRDYVEAGKFFGKILGLTFAVGVASGIVMEFQFGTNWAEYSKFVGDIFGAPLAAEAIFAFFLESAFLGLYLFGRGRVSKGLHWFSSLMVAIGSMLSAFWIIAANSWQQTPAGYVLRNGRAELTSFTEALLNPSTLNRFFHTTTACLVAGAFLMAGVSAYLLLHGKATRLAGKTLKLALIVGLLSSLAALFPTGDRQARQVAHLQPEKFAAMEGLIHAQSRAPLVVVAAPIDDPPRLEFAFEIPGMLSWMAFGNVDAEVQGLIDLEEDGWPTPPMVPIFISFHAMVGLGMLFIGLTAWGIFLLIRGKLLQSRRYLRMLLWSIPLPLLACELGWIVAEVGRQPWVVYRILKTADAVSMNVHGGEVLFSIIMFGLIYLALGALYVFLLAKKVKHGPEPVDAEGEQA
jgi:cytochrome d ubiquinol oxidase subunit I